MYERYQKFECCASILHSLLILVQTAENACSVSKVLDLYTVANLKGLPTLSPIQRTSLFAIFEHSVSIT